MKLDTQSVTWALDAISAASDSDLFPPTPEIAAARDQGSDLVDRLTGPQIQAFLPGSTLRFLVPKDELSFRPATCLDPQDSLILTALMHQLGEGIESRRRPRGQVFSYRFEPNGNSLYSDDLNWNDFWANAEEISRDYEYVVYCDIADFYNQIYHHVLENQLNESGWPNQATKWVINLLKATTAGVSRGLPVGPHAVHLLAEATLIPMDNALEYHGLTFIRYVDDVVIFCEDYEAAQFALGLFAETLDQQQQLIPQRHKTKIYERAEFMDHAANMVVDKPMDATEELVLGLIRNYSHGDPYQDIFWKDVDEADWDRLGGDVLSDLIERHLASLSVDYPRVSWLFRRIAQIGHPGAVETVLERLDELRPCLPSIVTYIASLHFVDKGDWLRIGDGLIDLLDSPQINLHPYFQVMVLSLFARVPEMNHFARISKMYDSSAPALRRQILLAAMECKAVDWLREKKSSYSSMDASQQLAYLHALSIFPTDE